MKRDNDSGINLSSTADIAFLLLIFFLVATTLDIDKGLIRKLPEPCPDPVKAPVVKKRNLLVVLINSSDKLMVQGKACSIEELKPLTIDFLKNENDKKELPEKKLKNIPIIGQYNVSKGIISIQNDRNTTYQKYIEVLNELIATGNSLKNECSVNYFSKTYDQLNQEQKNAVRKAVPIMISEAEPKEIEKY